MVFKVQSRLPWPRSKRRLQLCQLVLLFCVFGWEICVCSAVNKVFSIPEGKPVGTEVGRLSNQGGNVYVLSSKTPQFTVTQSNGVIKTTVVLDREKVEVYNLTINDFKDFTNPIILHVLIYVEDVNDNSPQFVGGSQNSVTISEPGSQSLGYKIIAIDRDNGANATKNYVIISGNINDVFKLDLKRETTKQRALYADLALNNGKVLDREIIDLYVLNISASDGGNPPRQNFLQLNVTVSDIDDNPPVFTSLNYTVSIAEDDKKTYTSIYTVSATDKDKGANAKIYYSIEQYSDPNNNFGINPNTGVISSYIPLDFEKKKQYILKIKAENKDSSNKLYSISTLTINILDVNDNSPQVHVFFYEGGSYQVYENANVGYKVARVRVTDADEGKNKEVNVTLEGGDGFFSMKYDVVNSESIIEVGKPLDREKHKDFILSAFCIDNGQPPQSTKKRFKINVGDINDNYPKCDRHFYTSRVFENATVNTSVASIHATDADTGINAEIVYSFTNSLLNTVYAKWFSIDPTTGAIRTATEIDREKVSQPILIVVVSDKGNPSLSSNCTVIVNISDTNDNNPIFNQSTYHGSIPENSLSNSYVLHVYAKDPDLGDHSLIKYTIPNNYTVPFKINNDSGSISTVGSIDYETNSLFQFQVIATDGGGRKAHTTVIVTILDENDNAPFFQPDIYHKEVLEDLSVTSKVLSVIASDKDSGVYSRLTYDITAGNTDGLFAIDTSSGSITVAKKLDRETMDSHVLMVSAVDGGGRPSSNNATVNITVLDVNDEPPVFENSAYNYTIVENSQPQVMGTVKATSKDLGINAHITYSIIKGNVNNHFTINSTGTIYLRTPIDREKTPQFKLTIQAKDGGKPPLHSEVSVTIQVLDLNDNAPVFHIPNPGQVRVPENSPIATAFYNLTATDKDSDANSRLTYTITGGDGKGLFVINEMTGLLKTNVVFDYEERSTYSLDVNVKDAGSPPLEGNISIIITIAGVDEYSPVFKEKGYAFKVPGNAEVGDFVGQVSATDGDSGEDGVVFYSFVDPTSDAIIINSTSGVIVVNRTLNDGSELQQKRERRSIDFLEGQSFGSSLRVRREAPDDQIHMTVQADSGKSDSKKETSAVYVTVDFKCPGCGIVKGKQSGGGIGGDSLVIIVALAVLAGVILLILIVVTLLFYGYKKRKKARNKNPRLKFDGSFDEITVYPPSGTSNHGAVSNESLPPQRAYQQQYTPLTRTTDNSNNVTSTDASETPGSASSGRGSSDGDFEEAPPAYVNGDVNGSLHSENCAKTIVADSGIQENEDDRISQLTISDGSGILHIDDAKPYKNDKVLSRMDFQSQESMHVFGEEGGGEADGGHDVGNLLYAKLAEVDADDESISEIPRRFLEEGHDRGPYAGSLSSIIGSKEELSGSYNWDYLLDWGPQFQPLAEVFLEIGRMKDDDDHKTLHGRNGVSSIPSSRLQGHLPGISTTDMLSSMSSLPRSPVSPPSTQYTSPAFSPNFTPAITPLITRSPSVSPLDTGATSPSFSSPQGSRPSSTHIQIPLRTRRDSQGDSNSELSHSPSISDNESNLEIEI